MNVFIIIFIILIGLGILGNLPSIEDEKRKRIPCTFNDEISETDFKEIVSLAAKELKRLRHYSIEGCVVRGTVISQSGQSEWKFSIDFNDYGHITGKYWIYSDNKESNLPSGFANKIQERIKNRLIPLNN